MSREEQAQARQRDETRKKLLGIIFMSMATASPVPGSKKNNPLKRLAFLGSKAMGNFFRHRDPTKRANLNPRLAQIVVPTGVWASIFLVPGTNRHWK
jgi:hypothetical protein